MTHRLAVLPEGGIATARNRFLSSAPAGDVAVIEGRPESR
jgi:hypothetical protein